MSRLLACALALLLPLAAAADLAPGRVKKPVEPKPAAEGGPAPQVSAEALAWLAGSWKGEREGVTIEELWSAPLAGALVGHAREVKDGKIRLVELATIETEAGGLVLRLLHFRAGLQGTEERGQPLTWRLAKADATSAQFEGDGPGTAGQRLTYTRVDARTLTVKGEFLKGGKLVEQLYRYTRAE